MKRLVPAIVIALLSISFSLWGPNLQSISPTFSALAQEAPNEGTLELSPSILKESGCPVDIVSAKAILDFNTFGTPQSSRVYITYKNVSAKNVFSVNFRVRFTDDAGSDLGTFQGARTCTVLPDGEGSEKWKKEGVLNPKISSYKVRVLQVKFEDGSQWDSQSMANAGRTSAQQQDTPTQPQQDTPTQPQQESIGPMPDAPAQVPEQLPPIPFNTQSPAKEAGPVANPADETEQSGDAFSR